MVFVNARQRKAVMAKLTKYRVKVPVYNEIEVEVKAPTGDLDKIMSKAVEQAEKDEPRTYWQYDDDRADASDWDLVNEIDPKTDKLIPIKAESVPRVTAEELRADYAKDIAFVESQDLTRARKDELKRNMKDTLDRNIKDLV